MRNPFETHAEPAAERRGPTSSGNRRLWVFVAAALTLCGTLVTLVAANTTARTTERHSRAQQASAAAQVAASLQLSLDRERDLVVSEGAFVLGHPDVTNGAFAEWTRNIQAQERHPELEALGILVVVPAAELPAFAARLTADPNGQLPADGTYSVYPEGERPYYCLAPAGTLWNPNLAAPPGFDFCAADGGHVIMTARDTGNSSFSPYTYERQTVLSIQTPIYRGGQSPESLDQRRADFAGLVVSVIDPSVILNLAIKDHPGVSVSLAYDLQGQQATFTSGPPRTDDRPTTIDLGLGWTVRVMSPVAATSMLTDTGALGLLAAGVTMTLLLSALLYVLGTGRARALRVVAERTGELRHQALHDALTGLPNRTLITDRIDQLLARNRRHGTSGAALFVDIDEFKNVNDTLGHPAGDRLLVAVAARLENALRDADTIGRMGGDEFVVLLDGSTLTTGPALVAERLLDVMRQPFHLEGVVIPLVVNISIGIAVGDRALPADLLRDADLALYQAKATGKNRYEIFDPEMQIEFAERVEMEFALRSALEGEQFRVVYQPIYNLDDLELVGVEALLRWEHPTKGMIQPDEFIPLLEQSGHIQEVGRWVLHEACGQMALWHGRGDTLDISVNVSGRQLDHDDIVEDVRAALASSGLDPTSLIIEVTETALMDNADATASRLRAIKALGVRIAVDDFGTGYSSLAYLQQFPVDCLKIDRSFTSAIATSPESKALVSTLVQLGRDLGLSTLAEGVETTEQMDHLRGEHVDAAQGFLLARPVDPATLESQFLVPLRSTVPADHGGAERSR